MPALGAQRRIQALIIQGWSRARLARELHVEEKTLVALLDARRTRPKVHEAVAGMFTRLWDAPPPQATEAARAECAAARTEAQARGWMPPLAWDDIDTDKAPALTVVEPEHIDPVAVELAMAGENVKLTPVERLTALHRLCDQGLSASRIAVILHMNTAAARRQFDAYIASASVAA